MQALSSNTDQVSGTPVAQANPTGTSDSNQTPVISDEQSLKKMVPTISLGGSVAEDVCLAINQGSLPRDKPVLLKGLEFESTAQVNTIPETFQMENCSVKISLPSANLGNSSQSQDPILDLLSAEKAKQQALINTYNQLVQIAGQQHYKWTQDAAEQVKNSSKESQAIDLGSSFSSINSTICIKKRVSCTEFIAASDSYQEGLNKFRTGLALLQKGFLPGFEDGEKHEQALQYFAAANQLFGLSALFISEAEELLSSTQVAQISQVVAAAPTVAQGDTNALLLCGKFFLKLAYMYEDQQNIKMGSNALKHANFYLGAAYHKASTEAGYLLGLLYLEPLLELKVETNKNSISARLRKQDNNKNFSQEILDLCLEDPANTSHMSVILKDKVMLQIQAQIPNEYFNGAALEGHADAAWIMSRSVYAAQKRYGKVSETRAVNEPYGEYQSSFRYAQIASKNGHSEASFDLGLRFIKGDGVDKHEATGVNFLELAYQQSHPQAAAQLYKYYHNKSTTLGIVTDKELYKKAEVWGQIAGKLPHNTKN